MTSSPDRKRTGEQTIEPLPPAMSSMWRLCKLGYRHEPRLMIAAFVLSQLAALPDALLALWLMLLGKGVLDHRPGLVQGAAIGLGAVSYTHLDVYKRQAVLKHTDTIGMADGGEAMGDQDGCAMPCRGEQATEDLRFTPHVELRGRLVEQHHACAELDGCQRTGERDPLPLSPREVGAPVVSAGKHGVQ